MEILSFEGGAQPARKKKSLGLILGVALVAGVMTVGSTLAASVTVSSGAITFGQGVAQATACDNSITLTPGAGFTNNAGAGSFQLKTIRISDLDATDCDGKTFIIKAWDDNGATPLTLFGTDTEISSLIDPVKGTSTAPVGVTVSSPNSNDILDTIGSPSLDAEDIYKLTIEQQS